MVQVMPFVETSQQLIKDLVALSKRSTQPGRKEKIAMATALEFSVMVFIGFLVKQIHFPINSINAVVEYFCILGTSEQVMV
nr:protein transport protein Sec61 subunit gamma-like [Peromyscus maniculatus bairdii]